MTSLQNAIRSSRNDLSLALLITRREVRDSFRDWRVIIPIIMLTLIFPLLATFTARVLLNFTSRYGAELVGYRLTPFLLLVVGFFPMSFSLVIALETFVGEKERKSLEPLLATPLTNTQLYLGKMLAAIIPPMSTSYLGIIVYVLGLVIFSQWTVSWSLFVQILAISTVQGVVMVAAAVIVSSQTNTVRAANLLASFIIIPMALLLQVEAIVLFWGNSSGLWWIVLALVVTAAIFIRLGIQIFNREELLGQDIDQLRLVWISRQFWNRFLARDLYDHIPNPITWYRQLLGKIPELRLPAATLFLSLIGGLALGYFLAHYYSIGSTLAGDITGASIAENSSNLGAVFSTLPKTIFMQNVRVILIVAFLGIFTLGVTDVLIFMIPWVIVGLLGGLLAQVGENPVTFFLATILPHALIEVPALLLAIGAALRWHASIMARPPNGSISQQWIDSAADFWQVFVGLAIPLLIIAAFVEAYVTPQITSLVYGN